MAESINTFDDRTVRVLRDEVRRLKAQHFNLLREFALLRASAGVEVYVGKADGAITPRTDDTPGAGTVHVQGLDAVGDLLAKPKRVAVLNLGSAVSDGRPVVVHRSFGKWWLPADENDDDTAGDAVVRFELTADLALAGSAAAETVTWNGSAYAKTGEAITVRDYTGTLFKGASGYQGWATPRNDRGDYEILEMEHKARFVRFTLTEDMGATTSGKASASVVEAFDGISPGSTITVMDDRNRFQRALNGAKGLARYNPSLAGEEYDIIDCEQKAKWIRFTLSSTMTTASSTGSVTVADFWQGQNPDPSALGLTVHNLPISADYLFEGESGDVGLACYDEIDDVYRIVQMECPSA